MSSKYRSRFLSGRPRLSSANGSWPEPSYASTDSQPSRSPTARTSATATIGSRVPTRSVVGTLTRTASGAPRGNPSGGPGSVAASSSQAAAAARSQPSVHTPCRGASAAGSTVTDTLGASQPPARRSAVVAGDTGSRSMGADATTAASDDDVARAAARNASNPPIDVPNNAIDASWNSRAANAMAAPTAASYVSNDSTWPRGPALSPWPGRSTATAATESASSRHASTTDAW
mmetsp:Transcript_9638/g.39303  ORF Transcript_9638/g.39303 Transcript_9638/m.39303 type:complete len:232 (+) Transcript_9638:1447-2142(+)